jgi:hypothetical protein
VDSHVTGCMQWYREYFNTVSLGTESTALWTSKSICSSTRRVARTATAWLVSPPHLGTLSLGSGLAAACRDTLVPSHDWPPYSFAAARQET